MRCMMNISLITRGPSRRHQRAGAFTGLAVAWLGAASLLAPAAQAGESCIKCTGPAQSYRCVVSGLDASIDRRRLGFYCASHIARQKGHNACAAVRQARDCDGVTLRLAYDPDTDDLLAARSTDGENPHEKDKADKQDGPPGTVVELTRETARKTGESLERARDETVETTRGMGERVKDAVSGAATAIDRATRSTLKCIGTLFDEC